MKHNAIMLLGLIVFLLLPTVEALPDLQVVGSQMSAGPGHVTIYGEVQNFGTPAHYGAKVTAVVMDSSGVLATGTTSCSMGMLRTGESCWFGFEFNGLRQTSGAIRYTLTVGSDL
jgi:hypothetical protein